MDFLGFFVIYLRKRPRHHVPVLRLAPRPSPCNAYPMRGEGIILGALALAWGTLLWIMRPELLKLAREGGKGLRDRRVVNFLVTAAGILLPVGGAFLIVWNALGGAS